MVKVRLSAKELDDCDRAGRHRFEFARLAKKPHTLACKNTAKNDPVRDVQGLKAELAVAKLFGSEFSPFEFGPDNGVDLWIDEISVDVKVTTTQIENPNLLFMDGKTLKADVAILCRIEAEDSAEEVEIMGWIPKYYWEKWKKAFFHSPKDDAVPSSDLFPMYKLWVKQMQKRFEQ
jgi:hypothetical protein|tara:strand:- start:1168 stop:1695 length:528 start_codon:yes stop_codon:yes gene_type:complete